MSKKYFWQAKNFELTYELTKLRIFERYNNSFIGLWWTFLYPAIMLIVYWYAFTAGIKSQAFGNSDSKQVLSIIFAGLIFHTFFMECIAEAPSLIFNNPNYVKKVVFPLETLIYSVFNAALINLMVGFLMLILLVMFTGGAVSLELIFFPLLAAPLALFSLGLMWFLAALGVYFRDISYVMGFVGTATLFLSPVFYSLNNLSEKTKMLFYLNPISMPIEQLRLVLFYDGRINFLLWVFSLIYGALILLAGKAFFNRLRGDFADAL